MSISATHKTTPLATGVTFHDDLLEVLLSDGRVIGVPTEWFPRLREATDTQLAEWRLIGGGIGIRWDSVDEDLSVEKLLAP